MTLGSNSEDISSVTGAAICKGLLLWWNPRAEKTLDQKHITPHCLTLCTNIERCVVTLCNNDMICHTRCCIRNTSQQNWHPSRLARRLHQEMTGYHQRWLGHWHLLKFPGCLPASPLLLHFLLCQRFPQQYHYYPLSIVHSVNGVHSGNVHRGSLPIVFVS